MLPLPYRKGEEGRLRKAQEQSGDSRVRIRQNGSQSRTICEDSDGKCGIASVGALILRFQQRLSSEVITFHKKFSMW